MTDEVAENGSAEARMRSGRQFARDVLVNVLANLVAAAIVYMAAAFAGLLPRSPALLYTSALLVLGGMGILLFMAGLIMRRSRGVEFADLALVIYCLFIAGILFAPGGNLGAFERTLFLTMIVISIWAVVLVRRSRNHRSKK